MPDSTHDPDPDPERGLGLGIDAGGTQTRWALADVDGVVAAEGHVAGLSALQLSNEGGRAQFRSELARLAAAVAPHGRPGRVRAGLTGFGGDGESISGALAQALGVAPDAVTLSSDIEIAYAANFGPGQGYLVYAGTGSIGAFIDTAGTLHRAGGRGVALDDGGGGYWIAREAMRAIWRAEDECPGRWRGSPMAHAVFAHVGGSDWADSRRFMYAQERGAVGRLAMAVASAADSDPAAADILRGAGVELARLALALAARHGPRPVVLSGRAAALHPMLFGAMRKALPASTELVHSTARAHVAAARCAARTLSPYVRQHEGNSMMETAA
ncbi:N-acetylglucosamine kinase [Massilia glaciei]|uniref:ATPase n=1 Tax=Massilia glaciei TaxID=1524097 RepID=A0A2U2HEL2_9BURK|nr:BadF/BadG/BcrA/BcrD ATPase family protein [Massilia glaciei]PWF42052.1 ATPase [Massilia glaciei]